MKNVQMENETHGRAEGQKIHMFLEGLGPDLNIVDKIKIFLELQRTERIKMVTGKESSPDCLLSKIFLQAPKNIRNVRQTFIFM